MQPSRPRTGTCGGERTIHHIQVEIEVNGIHLLGEIGQRFAKDFLNAFFPDSPDRNALDALLVCKGGIGCGVRERLESHLNDVGTRKPVLKQNSNRIAVGGTVARVSDIEVGVEGDQSDLRKIGGDRA